MQRSAGKAFTLRLPPELYEPIAAMAARERRSLHGQVLYLLDRAIEALEDAADIQDGQAVLAALETGKEEATPLKQALAEEEPWECVYNPKQ
jgi:hypothetical protein